MDSATLLHFVKKRKKVRALYALSFAYGQRHARELVMGYNGQMLYEDLSFSLHRGERLGIIGPNGSGKTTLGKLLLGLYEPGSGMVTMDGTDIRAGIIKLGTGSNGAIRSPHGVKPGFGPTEAKFFRAAMLVHRKLGAPMKT
jgi:ABC-type cobalamin/Fe3+-siderophores transport system ATPase subunit